METTVRTRLSIDERRRQLLTLGRDLFTSRAYDDISIDDIAAAATISKGLLYHYFPSKRDFYVETLRATVEEVRAAIEPDLSLPLQARLHASVSAFIDMIERHPGLYVAVLRGGIGSDTAVTELVDDLRHAVVSLVFDSIGLADPLPLWRTTLRGWVSFIEEVCLDWVEHRDESRDHIMQLIELTLASVFRSAWLLAPDERLDYHALGISLAW